MYTSRAAEQAGVNPQTLRYYERRGLLADPERSPSGYRRYGPEAVRVVRFIKRVQELGCDLDQAKLLLDLAHGGPDDSGSAQRLAASMIAEVDSRIASLQAMRSCLERLVDTCHKPPRERECPLLDETA